jgi:hypothetical protein
MDMQIRRTAVSFLHQHLFLSTGEDVFLVSNKRGSSERAASLGGWWSFKVVRVMTLRTLRRVRQGRVNSRKKSQRRKADPAIFLAGSSLTNY